MASLSVSADLVGLFDSNDELTDMEVSVGAEKFRCHKVLMCLSSQFFRRLCSIGNRANFLELDLSELPGGSVAFRALHDFCKGKQFSLTTDNISWLMEAAEYLEMHSLLVECQRFWQTQVLTSWTNILALTSRKAGTLSFKRRQECTIALHGLISGFDTSDWQTLIAYKYGSGSYSGLFKLLEDFDLSTHVIGKLLLALEKGFIYRWKEYRRNRELVRINKLISYFHDMLLRKKNTTEEMIADEKKLRKAIEGSGSKAQLLSIMSFFCSFFNLVGYDEKLVAAYSTLFSMLEYNDLVQLGPDAVLILVKPFDGVVGCDHARKISGIVNQIADKVTYSDQALAVNIRSFVAGLTLFSRQHQPPETAAMVKTQVPVPARRKLFPTECFARKQPKAIQSSSNSSSGDSNSSQGGASSSQSL